MLPVILYKLLKRNLPKKLQETECWTLGKQVDGKNRAFQLDGCTHARNNHPKDWHTFGTCVKAAAELPEVDHLHVSTGAELDDDLVLAGFDFDGCVHPETSELDCRVNEINRHMGSYFEFSPSRTGLRILVQVPRGTKNISKQKLGFEFYAGKHFLSVCGNSNGVFCGERDHDARSLITATDDQVKQYYDFHNSVSAAFPADLANGQRTDYQLTPRKKRKADTKAAKIVEQKPEMPLDAAKEMTTIEAAMACLSAERAEYYDDWMDVMYGLKGAIRHLGEDVRERCRELWHEFSQLSDRYDSDYCEDKWRSFTERDAGDKYRSIGSLIHAAKDDDPAKFQKLMEFKIRSTKSDEEDDEEDDEPGTVFHTVNAATVQPKKLEWLWKDRFPQNALTIITGDAGDGKTFVICDLIARITCGTAWPDGFRCESGNVLLVNREDDRAAIQVPRLVTAGADLSRVEFFDALTVKDKLKPFDLNNHLEALQRRIIGTENFRLVVIDPLAPHIGDVRMNDYAESYALASSLNEVAQQTETTFVVVIHMNKSEALEAMHRVMGSAAWPAAARGAWTVCRDARDEDGKQRLFVPSKNNSAEDNTGLAFSIHNVEGIGQVRWEPDPVEMRATDALRALSDRRQGGQAEEETMEAEQFLRKLLKEGPVKSTEVEKEAKLASLSYVTCRRRKKSLGIVVDKVGFADGTYWAWRFEDDQTPEGAHEGDQNPYTPGE